MKYGNIWARIGGGLIDLLIVLVIATVILFCWGFLIGLNGTDAKYSKELQEEIWEGRALLVGLFVDAVYTISMQASSNKATVGQGAFDLVIVKSSGENASLRRLAFRYLISIPSSLVLKLGYVIAIFTNRKQTLHDLIANTVVIQKNVSFQNEELIKEKESNGGKEFFVFIVSLIGFFLVAYIFKNK